MSMLWYSLEERRITLTEGWRLYKDAYKYTLYIATNAYILRRKMHKDAYPAYGTSSLCNVVANWTKEQN